MKVSSKILKNISAVSLLIVFCLASWNAEAQSRAAMEKEMRKWYKELSAMEKTKASEHSFEEPCGENPEEWVNENPGKSFTFYGLIESANGDPESATIEETLYYVDMMDCKNNSYLVSTPGIFFYPEEGELRSNPHITSEVENNIQEMLRERNISFSKVVVRFRGLNELVYGKYYLFQDGDEICCPSSRGDFKYDPIMHSSEIEFD